MSCRPIATTAFFFSPRLEPSNHEDRRSRVRETRRGELFLGGGSGRPKNAVPGFFSDQGASSEICKVNKALMIILWTKFGNKILSKNVLPVSKTTDSFSAIQ
jgi:hypothetical protein